MGTYYTGSSECEISDEKIDEIIAQLQEVFGCFRLYAIDMNGRCIFTNTENSEMETRCLRDLVRDIEIGYYGGMGVDNFEEEGDFDGLEDFEEGE